jgi:hypothetical protein
VLAASLVVYPAYFGLVGVLDAWLGGGQLTGQVRFESGRALALDVLRTAVAGLWVVLPITTATALVTLGRGATTSLRDAGARLLACLAALAGALTLAGCAPMSSLVLTLALSASGAASVLVDRMTHRAPA